jgi:hypothetical protein
MYSDPKTRDLTDALRTLKINETDTTSNISTLFHNKNLEQSLFQSLEQQAKQGLWMRWLSNPDDEIKYLKKTNNYNPQQFKKFRRSRTDLQRKKSKINHWYDNAKKDFDKFTETPSDNESDEEMKGEKYEGPKSFTYKFDDCIISDYRYSERVLPTSIGILVRTQDDFTIPYILQYDKATGYTEYVETPKKDIFNFPEDYKTYAKNPISELNNKKTSEISECIKTFYEKRCKEYPYFYFVPYNEALFRYQTQHIQAILLNYPQSKEKQNKIDCMTNALEFYFQITEQNQNCQPIFCTTKIYSFHLQQIPLQEILTTIPTQIIKDKWENTRPQEMELLLKLKTKAKQKITSNSNSKEKDIIIYPEPSSPTQQQTK